MAELLGIDLICNSFALWDHRPTVSGLLFLKLHYTSVLGCCLLTESLNLHAISRFRQYKSQVQ